MKWNFYFSLMVWIIRIKCIYLIIKKSVLQALNCLFKKNSKKTWLACGLALGVTNLSQRQFYFSLKWWFIYLFLMTSHSVDKLSPVLFLEPAKWFVANQLKNTDNRRKQPCVYHSTDRKCFVREPGMDWKELDVTVTTEVSAVWLCVTTAEAEDECSFLSNAS